MYKYEMHMHSNGASACGKSSITDMIRAYHAAGYAGAVITDHFILGNTSVPRDLPWRERMQRYYDVYLQGKPAADELDFDLLFGIEHGYGNWKEMLVYNVTIDFLIANEDISVISVQEFGRRIHEAGGYISHAHPYRFRPYMGSFHDPVFDMCDAVEVYNFSDIPEANAQALAQARKTGLAQTSGADSHWDTYEGIGKAGMAFPRRIRNERDLADALRKGEGKLIIDGKIVD